MRQFIGMQEFELVDKTTGYPTPNDSFLMLDTKGVEYTITGGRPPLHDGSSGRIWYRRDHSNGSEHGEFFPHVFGLEWRPV